jgi:hypothetical protein
MHPRVAVFGQYLAVRNSGTGAGRPNEAERARSEYDAIKTGGLSERLT